MSGSATIDTPHTKRYTTSQVGFSSLGLQAISKALLNSVIGANWQLLDSSDFRSAALLSITAVLVRFVFLLCMSRGGQKLQLTQSPRLLFLVLLPPSVMFFLTALLPRPEFTKNCPESLSSSDCTSLACTIAICITFQCNLVALVSTTSVPVQLVCDLLVSRGGQLSHDSAADVAIPRVAPARGDVSHCGESVET